MDAGGDRSVRAAARSDGHGPDAPVATAVAGGPAAGPSTTERIGALHGDAWSGLVLSPGPGEGLAFRFAVRREGSEADLRDLYALATDVGPWAPDGRYARVGFDLELPWGEGDDTPVVERDGRRTELVVEWARVGVEAVVGRVELAGRGELCLRPYVPWDWRGEWRVSAAGARGRTSGARVVSLAVTPTGEVRGRAGDARAPGAAAPPDELWWPGPVRVEFAAVLERRGGPGSGGPAAGAAARSTGEGTDAWRTDRGGPVADASTSPPTTRARRMVAGGAAATLVRAARSAYQAERPRVDGVWRGLSAAVADTVHALILLQPETGRLYSPAGRSWVFPRAPERGGGRDHWTLFCWDGFFNALELGWESPDRARDAVRAVLATALENGCVPNWRGRDGATPDRSQPPVGSLAVLELHLRTGDRRLLEESYPALARWAAWWGEDVGGRPRRGAQVPGLFAWGSDLERVDPYAPPWERDARPEQLAAWESGQDDLPTWDEAVFDEAAGVLDLTPVDLNAYRVLDEECLGRMAELLGAAAAAAAHHRRAAALRERMNEVLWDEETGSYRDRRADGSWARCRAAAHFLPLVAGVPPPERAGRMVQAFEDAQLFGGGWPVPTVSRADPHFPQQQYWRGTIWPPVNYLVHKGLRRYGFDVQAGELAARSAELFLGAWRRTGLARENFDSRSGEGGGRRHQSWGPLLGLLALEELACVTPWGGPEVGGLRPPGPVRIRRLALRGRLWDVALGPDGLTVETEGLPRVVLDAPAVLRHLELDTHGVAAEVHVERAARLAVEHPGDGADAGTDAGTDPVDAVVLRTRVAGRAAGARDERPRRSVPSVRAEVDGSRVEVEGGGVRMPAGRHRVVVRWG